MQAITAKAAGTLTWMTANAATWHFEEKKKTFRAMPTSFTGKAVEV